MWDIPKSGEVTTNEGWRQTFLTAYKFLGMPINGNK